MHDIDISPALLCCNSMPYAAPTSADSTGIYEVTCSSNPSTVSLPTLGFTASLTVTQSATGCTGTPTTVPVTPSVRKPPDFSVEPSPPSPINVCSVRGSLTASFGVTGAVDDPRLLVALTPADGICTTSDLSGSPVGSLDTSEHRTGVWCNCSHGCAAALRVCRCLNTQ